jgi:regulator of protease activity HflC (stomatin/prohibitin superfamily)
MEDHEVLRHLLDIEKEAAALVDDAQAEADRRISEGEKQNRVAYDDAYSNELKALESSYAEKIAAVNEDYRKQMEKYRENLKAVSPDIKNFSSLAGKFLRVNDRDEP